MPRRITTSKPKKQVAKPKKKAAVLTPSKTKAEKPVVLNKYGKPAKRLANPDQPADDSPWGRLKPYQYKKGETGNPAGKKKGTQMTLRGALRNQIRKKLPKPVLDDLRARGICFENGTWGLCVIERLAQLAIEGNLTATQVMFDHTELPLKQTLDIENRTIFSVVAPPKPKDEDADS